jgi:hypothetical protein
LKEEIMATGSNRITTLIVALLAGLVLGYIARAEGIFDWLFTPTGVRAIVVGPEPSDLTTPKLKISKEKAQVVFWVARDPEKKLRIEFEKEPFADMTKQDNGRYLVQCEARWCFSREIKGPYEDYKYWQILIGPDGTPHEADGRIIIDR